MPIGPFSSRDIPDELWEENAAQWRAAQDGAEGGGQPSADDEAAQLKAFQKMMADPSEEGRRNDVYKDSLGIATVGIGHRVRPEDNLRVGQRISDAQVDAFFHQDGAFALKKARDQAAQAGIDDPAFIRRLGAATFQLGWPKWPGTFPKTWNLIRSGDYEGAATELYNSKWAKQTPRRVDAFRDDLLKLPPKAHR